MDDGQHTACCQTSDPETIESDPEQFACDTCTVRLAIDGLEPENRAAWRLFRRVCTRFHVETQTVGLALDRLTAGLDTEEFADVTTRLAILFDVHFPTKKAAGDGA